MVMIYSDFLMKTSGKFITLKSGIPVEGRSFLWNTMKDFGLQAVKGGGLS